MPPPGPGPAPMSMPLPFSKVRYHYHTADGGPPGEGKPPALPGPSTSGAPTPGMPAPFGFPASATTCPPGWFCSPPATSGPPSQPPASGCVWFPQAPPPTTLGPPAPTAAAPMFDPFAPQTSQFPSMAPRFAPNTQSRNLPAPGNRVHDRIIKADNGTGYLTAEEVTTFHVLQRGLDFSDLNGIKLIAGVQFNVQTCDSTWTVQTLMRRLGATDLSQFPEHHQLGLQNVAAEQWHEQGNGRFERGTCIMYLDPKAKCNLKEVGWGPEHGRAGAKPPIWLMIYPSSSQITPLDPLDEPLESVCQSWFGADYSANLARWNDGTWNQIDGEERCG